MPTIIDSLVVTLGLDNKEFKAAAQETTDITNTLVASLKVLKDTYDSLGATLETFASRIESARSTVSDGVESNNSMSSANINTNQTFNSLNQTLTQLQQTFMSLSQEMNLFSVQSTNVSNTTVNVTNNIQKQAKVTEKTSKSLMRLAFAYVSFRGIKNFIADTISSSASIERLSVNLDENASSLKGLSNVSKQLTGGHDGATEFIDKLHELHSALNFGQGPTPFFHLLQRFQTMPLKGNGDLRDTTTVLLEFHKALKASPLPRADLFKQLQSEGGLSEYAANLLLTDKNLEEMLEDQKKLNNQFDAQAAAAQRVSEQFQKLQQVLENIGRTAIFGGEGGLESVLGKLNEFALKASENATAIKVFFGVFAAGVTAVSIASSPLLAAITAIGGLSALVSWISTTDIAKSEGDAAYKNFMTNSHKRKFDGNTQKGRLDALAYELGIYGKGGANTLHGLISNYVSNNHLTNGAAIEKAVSQFLHTGGNEQLNATNPESLGIIARAIMQADPKANSINSSNQATTSVKIDTININSNATDSNGIAKDIGHSLTDYLLTSQANSGIY